MPLPLPPFAPFPIAEWRENLPRDEWATCLVAWSTLSHAYLTLSPTDLQSQLSTDPSATDFLLVLADELARHGPGAALGTSPAARALLSAAFQLSSALLVLPSSPLLRWTFLADLSRVYGKKQVGPLLANVGGKKGFEAELLGAKRDLTRRLEEGIHGDVRAVEADLARLNHLIHASPDAAATFLAGSDFFDALVAAYRIMNPPLRKVLVATAYLCHVGLMDGGGEAAPRTAMLSDQLFALKAAADAHRAGPLRESDSLVVDLVSSTPLLRQLVNRAEASGSATGTLRTRITALEAYRRPGAAGAGRRSGKVLRRKKEKGKGLIVIGGGDAGPAEINVHRASQITQIQDLFPDLGAGFVARCLDEYAEDTEAVIAHLLEESLPPHLAEADRKEELYASLPFPSFPFSISPSKLSCLGPVTNTRLPRSDHPVQHPTPLEHLEPRATPPIPERRNVHDDDELDRLTVSTSALHFGKRDAERTADEMLEDKSSAPHKSAIYSALLAFDSDDDERDDTYDADDVGGAVDAGAADESGRDSVEETLYRTYQADRAVFAKGAAGRPERERLRAETGMEDQALEGWAMLLERSPQLRQRLENKYTSFSGAQEELRTTRWRAGEESDGEGGSGSGSRGGRGRGRGRGRGALRGRGGASAGGGEGESSEVARRRKEAAKGSRANHNRRDQRARKMARGGGFVG